MQFEMDLENILFGKFIVVHIIFYVEKRKFFTLNYNENTAEHDVVSPYAMRKI